MVERTGHTRESETDFGSSRRVERRKTGLGTRGPSSQTDLLILTQNKNGTGILAVERKAREPFGPFVKDWCQASPSEGREQLTRFGTARVVSIPGARTPSMVHHVQIGIHPPSSASTSAP